VLLKQPDKHKVANLNGRIPADITGQFVTNGMPQLYPRDAMMCARVLLLTGHTEEARQVIEFWARPEVPMKTPGEWYARYDAHGNGVDAGSGARFDEPEWDANGYYIYLLNEYHRSKRVWLADARLFYELADFLVRHCRVDRIFAGYEYDLCCCADDRSQHCPRARERKKSRRICRSGPEDFGGFTPDVR